MSDELELAIRTARLAWLPKDGPMDQFIVDRLREQGLVDTWLD